MIFIFLLLRFYFHLSTIIFSTTSFCASYKLASLYSVLILFPAVLSHNFQSIFCVLFATCFIFLLLSFHVSPSGSAVVFSTISNFFIQVSPSFSSSQFPSLILTANLPCSSLLEIFKIYSSLYCLLYFSTLIFLL